MASRRMVCLLAAAILASGTRRTTAGAPDVAIPGLGAVTRVDVPEATSTFALDVNADGIIVGRYLTNGQTHGFLRTPEGDFVTIDVPGASLTVAAGINDRGDVVGQYALSTEMTHRHGFLLKDGVFTSFDPPGSTFTNALSINERGDIVGRYCTLASCSIAGTGVFHGFLLRDGAFATLDVPGSSETDPFSINGSGRIAGGFLVDHSQEQIFVLDNQALSTFATPSGRPVALDKGAMNERGDIVGAYCDALSPPCALAPTHTHGFLVNADGFTTIDIPGALATGATGINARGDVVGGYSIDGHVFHGFLLRRKLAGQ